MAKPRHSVRLVSRAALPTRFGEFDAAVFEDMDGPPGEILALTRGALDGKEPPLVRLHSECLTGDVLGSLRCDCGQQLAAALELIAEAAAGVLLYLPQEGRGIGLANKIRAYALQDTGLDTVDANLALGLPVDTREYASAALVLRELGLRQVRLLTNNPLKSAALELHGVQVIERVPIAVPPNSINRDYLRTKANRMGHLLVFER
jgi:GTP cyclohydrolase II